MQSPPNNKPGPAQPVQPASNMLRLDAAVMQLMEPIDAILADYPGATEFAMVRPGEAFIEQNGKWHQLALPAFTIRRCLELANGVGIYANQDVSARTPLLSATLPGGQRIQIVVPPAVEAGRIAICIRIPGSTVRPLESYVAAKAFDRFVWAEDPRIAQYWDKLPKLDQKLVELLRQRDLLGFIIASVKGKKNIAAVGDTGSGKTTLMKAMCQYIPFHERILTIEDVRELYLPNHPNHTALLYSKGGQGVAKVTPADLIGATMRLKPDRTLLAELRGSEAFDFLKLMTAGHSGTITSFHAESCALAGQRYVFMAKEHPDAAIFQDEALKRLVELTIDTIIHVTAEPIEDARGEITGLDRYVTEVAFNPACKLVEHALRGSAA